MRELPTKQEARKWAEALRSGKYQQATGMLHNKEGYCCLGVACDLFIPKDKVEYKHGSLIAGWTPYYQTDAPYWLKQVNDIAATEMGIGLANLNDSHGYTFDELADVIEILFIHDRP